MDTLSIPLLFSLLVVLLLLSAFFSGTETAMMAVNRYRLESLSKKNGNARRAQRLLDDLDNLIGTILLGNNFVNILASSIVTILAIQLWGEGSVIYAAGVLTIVILIFAETTPKTFAAKNPESIALPASYVISAFALLLRPLVFFITRCSVLLLRLLNLKNIDPVAGLSKEELRIAVNDAKSLISDDYRKMLVNLIDLEKISVDNIMVPRQELIGIDLDDEEDVVKKLQYSQHTKLLAYEKTLDNLIGIVHLRDVTHLAIKEDFDLNTLRGVIQKPSFIVEGTSLSLQLKRFKANKERQGIVIDEYGEIKGMVFLDDILEEVVGQFTSDQSKTVDEITPQGDGKYLIDPKINLRDLNAHLKTDLASPEAHTLNGYILELLESIPERGTSFKVEGLLIEILQASKHGIKVVKLTKLDPHSNANSSAVE